MTEAQDPTSRALDVAQQALFLLAQMMEQEEQTPTTQEPQGWDLLEQSERNLIQMRTPNWEADLLAGRVRLLTQRQETMQRRQDRARLIAEQIIQETQRRQGGDVLERIETLAESLDKMLSSSE